MHGSWSRCTRRLWVLKPPQVGICGGLYLVGREASLSRCPRIRHTVSLSRLLLHSLPLSLCCCRLSQFQPVAKLPLLASDVRFGAIGAVAVGPVSSPSRAPARLQGALPLHGAKSSRPSPVARRPSYSPDSDSARPYPPVPSHLSSPRAIWLMATSQITTRSQLIITKPIVILHQSSTINHQPSTINHQQPCIVAIIGCPPALFPPESSTRRVGLIPKPTRHLPFPRRHRLWPGVYRRDRPLHKPASTSAPSFDATGAQRDSDGEPDRGVRRYDATLRDLASRHHPVVHRIVAAAADHRVIVAVIVIGNLRGPS
jgi:hypothetical protein